MKKIFLLFIATICIISGCTINKQNINNNNTLDLSNDKNKKTVFLNENWKESQSPYSDSVVCTFKISAVTDFEKDHISGEVNVSDKPMTLTFVDIAADSPSIIGNLGDKATLLKIDNGSIVYLIEKTDFGNINIFTLFRDKNIMIMSKQYNLVGKPFGMIMMGDCLSGV